jgi:hypothetical protein
LMRTTRIEPQIGLEPLHDDEHTRMQTLDSVQAVLPLGLMTKKLHHTLGETLTDPREELRVVAEPHGQRTLEGQDPLAPRDDKRWSTSSPAVSPMRRPMAVDDSVPAAPPGGQEIASAIVHAGRV